MSTRLNSGAKADAKRAIDTLLSSGVKFIDCPLTNEEMVALWAKMNDPEYYRSIHVINEHLSGSEYHTMDDDVEFYVGQFERNESGVLATNTMLYNVKLCLPERGFIKASKVTTENAPGWRAPRDNNRMRIVIPRQYTFSFIELRGMLGAEKATAFEEWMEACITMDREMNTSKKVLDDLFEMIKTSGQLKRMVPDLFKYIPDEQRKAFDDQKHASSYPFEWPAYPKKDVETFLMTLLKCHLLQGSATERRKDVSVDWRKTWVTSHQILLGQHDR